jgi:hypothetical protein
MNSLTKKRILFLSFFGLIIQIISRYSVDFGVCENYASSCFDLSYLFIIYSIISIPLFVFSVITYKLKDEVFISWKNFSIWWIPLSFVIITMFPTDTHGMDFVPIIKGTVSLLLSSLYSVISLVIILYKSFKK